MTQTTETARVLIVDDDPLARETLEALLRREQYHLLFAASGVDVLPRMDELAPDLILMDIMMPGMNGFDVCRQLKAMPEYRHIPIILITALDSTADFVRGLDSGADEFISKPFNTPELKARIRSMLRSKRQYDALQYTLQTRDLLSNMIVHDMRNPLAAVMLYIQLLKRRGNLQPEQEHYLDMIFNEAHHVSSFLEDMLLLNKLDRGSVPLTLSRLDLGRMLADITQKTQAIVTARKVDLVIAEPPATPEAMKVDMMLFQRALENMIAHAIKSAPSHSQVTVTCQLLAPTPPANHRLRIEVGNEGSHLAEEDLHHIFDRFAVMMLKERGQSHVGLGLAHCRMVVEAHGGQVKASNRQPTGLLFTIDLP